VFFVPVLDRQFGITVETVVIGADLRFDWAADPPKILAWDRPIDHRIRDADVAAEAANLTKAQVLQQASLAAMAQANSAPQAVLSLLKG